MTLPNEHLEHEVAQSLLQSKQLSSQRIDIEAEDGHVTLSGEVQSFRRKLAAQQVAESCQHVDNVTNQIVVESPDAVVDHVLEQNIHRRFKDDAHISAQAILVESRSGVVKLSGYVTTNSVKALVADVAKSVDGVRQVDNRLVVNPDSVLANTEQANAVRVAIGRIIGMEDEKINVSIVDKVARISGKVDETWKKEAAEKTVRKFGFLHVRNDIVAKHNR